MSPRWASSLRRRPNILLYLIVGNGEKVAFTDGKPVLSPPGKDTVSAIDIRDRAKPRIVVNLSLENSVFGPPINLAITPDGKLALVANSIDVVKDGDTLKSVPDNKLFVIDLTTSPPAVIATIQTGKQSSRMAISRAEIWPWLPIVRTTA
ncbi:MULTISPECIES: hypothetical protein [unclassified Bradyrhizobium]|uniref:hypothetical protein n=1 Tax=unclassified Bradyrhizobium TaxID=2631580 RepID=UPI0024787017|nr:MULTISPECIES: hypothetical protein [unclassified Bradyrhizobium]WGS18541.1 hypothetical protein MTX22_28825 [Bradyrhizobium sp. ISRA463]WGS25366.1 hypothetical protein MTX19_26420 [Bradyrhizobium sp. ISRA464]